MYIQKLDIPDIETYTVAITAVVENLRLLEEEKGGTGSGVLVRLQNRYFILTAGHCVREVQIAKKQRIQCFVCITKNYPFRHTLNFINAEFDYELNEENGPDFGFFELDEEQAKLYTNKGKNFLSTDNILCLTKLDAPEIRTVIVAGYPDSDISIEWKLSPFYLKEMIYRICRSRFTINDLDNITIDDNFIKIYTDKEKWKEGGSSISEPRFKGSSGGGCWVYDENRKLFLVGTHTGKKENTIKKNNTAYTIFVENNIINHLKLLSENYFEFNDIISKIQINSAAPSTHF